jgi:4-amino-4-deoxy-L-arabinose transferase-like glycosyltransferase
MTETAVSQAEPQRELFGSRPILWWALVALIFGVGLLIRVYDLSDAPLDFHPTRQLHSALIARGMYYENLPGVPQWQRDMAVAQWKAEGLIEPQVFERFVSWMYALTGRVDLRIPRLFSILFWTLGGVALLWLARAFAGRDGALVAVLFYMIWPYAAIASRSFQPDLLMVALILWTLWALLHWQGRPTWAWTVVTGLLAGVSIYIKSVAVFFVAPALAFYLLTSLGLRPALRSPKVWLMGFLAVLPYALYHIDGVYIHKYLVGQFSLRFFPQLWIDPTWYLRWNGQISHVVSFELFLIAVAGAFLVQRKDLRLLLLGLWVGYIAYGLTLPYHISTHDYYQLPLFPLVALGLAAAAGILLRHVRGPAWLVVPALTLVLLWGLTVKAWDVRVTLKRDDYRSEVRFWEKLRDVFPENPSVIGLVQDYGTRLSYWSWINAGNWMVSGDFALRELAGESFDMTQTFNEAIAGKDFFLITLLDEYERQPALKSLLEQHYPIYKQAPDYIIYDLRTPLPAPSTTTP